MTDLRSSYHRWNFPLVLLFSAWILAAQPVGAAEIPREQIEFFERDIRPIFVEQCGSCHGANKQKGGLRLDSRAALLTGGGRGPAMVAGNPEQSLLIQAVRRQGELAMPPNKPLSEPQRAALSRWVSLGAPWPASATAEQRPAATHWAFQPIRNPPLPAVRDAAWCRTPIDRFILARLEAEQVRPSPPADARNLIRRVTYDLTGLPPTPEEVQAFLSDDAPDAYERLIDRLLASARYGEQWGRHWLDVARYSDTKGYVYGREERFWVHAWAYRDWVVRALNEDMPYDRFLQLQLAADQVAPDDPPAQAALGFLTLGRRFLGVTNDIIDDRIDVVSRGMLGLTVACARCHNHKYDPISAEDYYALAGVFRSCDEKLVPAGPAATGPSSAAFTRGLEERQNKLNTAMARHRAEAAARVRSRVTEYLLAQLELSKYPEEGFDVVVGVGDLVPASIRRWRDHLAKTAKRRDPIFAPWHAFAALPEKEFAQQAPRIVTELAQAPPGTINPFVLIAFARAPGSMAEVARRYGELFTSVEQLWQARTKGVVGPTVGLSDPALEALRRVLYGPEAPCTIPDESIVNNEWYFPTDVIVELWKLQGEVDRWLINSPNAPPHALVLVDKPEPINAKLLRRGNPATPAGEVPRRFLRFLSGPEQQPFAQGSGRVELARAIVDPQNPLTARVLVNRVWLHHFGSGLVQSPSDFGTRAEPPTHPELLDWLATRFVQEGWSLKKLHRLILLSAVYRQASNEPSGPTERDPDNRWLGRMNARRLSFEEMRDSLYAVTGDLDSRGGGKPAALFAAPFPRRRTLYGLIDRQFLPGLLRAFDFANPDLHIPQRSETTVPQQALFFLNHPLLLDRARALARHPAIQAAPTPEEKIKQLYLLTYQREPTTAQSQRALALIQAAESEPESGPVGPLVWSYGYGAFNPETGKLTDFRPLPHFSGTAWQGGPAWPDGKLGWAQLTATGGHAGDDLARCVVRRWTAPMDGTVRIESLLAHQAPGGDGVRGTILSSRHGVVKTAVAENAEVKLIVPDLTVQAGDTIDFVVDLRQNISYDEFSWAPEIHTVVRKRQTSKVWNAKAEFAGPMRFQFGPWEQLAQALLMANEFSFVD